ncbi:hypothetical protein BTO18_12855 [Polaribacter porphyrae]|uniref:Uncharacterized protein n=1 Tax=Polaribacter porphyrae TaxID=1137780 RepID=A0A2S7WQZ6_9FLAO|nr:hypothetical protein BTO18_12855 [Polaribacter porphyrae]
MQEEFEKKVTFIVDTNGIENITSLGIRGNFLPNQWRETVPLKDDDNDGVYEITFNEKTAVYGISFKFVQNGFDYELKNEENRQIVFEYKPETIVYKTKFNNSKSEITRK